MPKITAKLIRDLREKSGAPMMRVKKVLEETKGDTKKAFEILKKEGLSKMEKRSDRETGSGIVVAYSHHTARVGALVELLCETDFVARNEMFIELSNSLALQVASMNPKNVKELLKQDFIKDSKKKIGDLVEDVKVKTGENVRIGRFERIEIGV